MNKIATFIKTSILGGLTVILPITIFMLILKWFYNFVITIIQPITELLIRQANYQKIIADVIAIFIVLGLCFLFGILIKTKIGRIVQKYLENSMSRLVPGYSMIKTTVTQLFDRDKFLFSSAALVEIAGMDTLVTAFISDEHEDGRYTVFVPTGPNPTTGLILHLKPELVHPINVKIEDAFRSIISCGAGSKMILNALKKKMEGNVPTQVENE